MSPLPPPQRKHTHVSVRRSPPPGLSFASSVFRRAHTTPPKTHRAAKFALVSPSRKKNADGTDARTTLPYLQKLPNYNGSRVTSVRCVRARRNVRRHLTPANHNRQQRASRLSMETYGSKRSKIAEFLDARITRRYAVFCNAIHRLNSQQCARLASAWRRISRRRRYSHTRRSSFVCLLTVAFFLE